MSGSPKYSSAQIQEQRRRELERRRQEQAAIEAKRRAEIAERERQRRLQNLIRITLEELDVLDRRIKADSGHMYAADADKLRADCDHLRRNIKTAQSENRVNERRHEIARTDKAAEQAIRKKHLDDIEQQRQEDMVRLRMDAEELKRCFKYIPRENGRKFDAPGQITVEQALSALATAIASGNPQSCQRPLVHAREVLSQHERIVDDARAKWERRCAAAEAAIGEMEALLAGMRDDEVLMRWHGQAVSRLGNEVDRARSATAEEAFEKPVGLLAELRQTEERLVAEANRAQLQADERDYIANAIAESLRAMGFFVGQPQAEDPSHPLSVLNLTAQNASGQGIGVSVPAEGDVWYDVNGFEMKAKRTVDGGTAPTCDKAEGILEQLHEGVAEAFGIEMGEIRWDGKVDPDRILRKADDLPGSAQQIGGGAGR